MKSHWKERLAHRLCKVFGHSKKFSHYYRQNWYLCKRCKRMFGEDSEKEAHGGLLVAGILIVVLGGSLLATFVYFAKEFKLYFM